VPEPLLVPAEPPVEGTVAVEPPDAPMPDLAPEVDEGVVAVPLAVPAADPMPEADPEAEPEAVVPQAARPAAQARARRVVLIIDDSF
jgi:hypothetical protein